VRYRRGWIQLTALSGLVAGSIVFLGWLVWLLLRGGLSRSDQLANAIGLASLVVAVASLLVSIRQLRQPAAVVINDTERLDRAAAALTKAVYDQWDAEAGLRALRQPAPLQLTWSATTRPVAALPADVLGGSITGRVVGLRLRGHLDQVADHYLALPHRRLVVLGEPGAGKTVLAMMLTLALLERRQPSEPVAVLLGLAAWDPTAEHLHTWLARRLDQDYPDLGGPSYGPDVALQLVTSGRVLPVLDGLDELPEPLQAHAIRELDRARAARPVIVTCRSQEFEQAVAIGGGVLARAAVIELAPVTAAEVIRFLPASTGPGDDRWDRVAAHLRAHPDGALAGALSTPLMVALARTIYVLSSRDPSELVNFAEAGGQAAVERQLLDGFIPAAYTSRPPAPGTPAPRLRRPPRHELAHHWLTVLAGHLHRQGTRDLAWWELVHLIPRRMQRLVGGLVFGLVLGLAGGLLVWLTDGLTDGLVAGLVVGLVGFVSRLLVRLNRWGASPTQINIQIRDRAGELISRLAAGLRAGLRVGLWVGLPFALLIGLLLGLPRGLLEILAFGLVAWLSTAFAVGLMVGLVIGLTEWLQSPIEDAPAVTPGSTLRGNRSAALARGFVVGLVVGLVAGLVYGGVLGLVSGLLLGLLVGLFNTSWGGFAIARVWLALLRRLPLRVMAFLDDAHRRGVLRQVGAAYQFRHARLQDHLVATSRVTHPDHR
jgi:hypothetical protein